MPENKEISNALLANSTGVLHLGAHIGQEAAEYSRTGHSVIWVEGDPRTFRKLKRNIKKFPNQIAVKALLDERERDVRFWRANNSGASSSVFPLAQNHGYKSIGLAMVGSRKIRSARLDQLFSESQLSHFNHWVLDLQGSELRALRGAGELLSIASSLEVEISREPQYDGGVLYPELRDFLMERGFREIWAEPYFHGIAFFERRPVAQTQVVTNR